MNDPTIHLSEVPAAVRAACATVLSYAIARGAELGRTEAGVLCDLFGRDVLGEVRAVAPPGAEPDLSALALRLAPDGDDAMTARLAFQDVVDAFHQTAPDNSYWRSVLEDWLVGASRREEPPAP